MQEIVRSRLLVPDPIEAVVVLDIEKEPSTGQDNIVLWSLL
jgi:hypothetical protein